MLVLSFFLTVGNTLKAVNNSLSVVEYIKEARKGASATQKDNNQSIIESKFCELSQFDEAQENEDLDHDINGFLSYSSFDSSPLLFINPSRFACAGTGDIVLPPLFILYCQSKAYLG